MRFKTLYVAGPMTGLPEFNIPAFNAAEGRLSDVGYSVLNPARRGYHPHLTWLDYMREALKDVAAADGIAYLDGWENSRGASIEVRLVRDLGLPAEHVRWWLP